MPKKDQQDWGHLFGMGSQTAVGVALGVAVGVWLDRRFGWAPWGVLIGAMLGLASGMYLLIRDAIRANKD